jgi:zinc transporter ZupT
VSAKKEAYFSAVSAGLILASATGGLISGAVTTAGSEGIHGALPLSSGLLCALVVMVAFERLLAVLQRRKSSAVSWILASPDSRDPDDEGTRMLQAAPAADAASEGEFSANQELHGRQPAAATAHTSSVLHEVIEQTLAAHTSAPLNREPTAAKVRAAMTLVLAMMVHHVPESMALGVAVYGVSDGSIQQGQCIVLAAVLALQNIPEGAACTSSLRMLGLQNSWRMLFFAQLAGMLWSRCSFSKAK